MGPATRKAMLQIHGPEKGLWELALDGDNLFFVAKFEGPSFRGISFDNDQAHWEKFFHFLNDSQVPLLELKMVCTPEQRPHLESWEQRLAIRNYQMKWVERPKGTSLRFWPKDGILQGSRASSEMAKEVQKKIKVLVVDDSRSIRTILKNLFSDRPELEVVALAERPSEVEALIKTHEPDVITLDIHMPEMTGVELLKTVIKKYHIPTVMITSISMAEGPLVMEALNNGAIDYIQKPSLSELSEVGAKIVEKVIAASQVNIHALMETEKKKSIVSQKPATGFRDLQAGVILIGSSTGGTQALQTIFEMLPDKIPPILVVQHIPPDFSKALAERLNSLCPFTVKEAEDGELVTENKILVAPGGKQMGVKARGRELRILINEDPPLNRFKPSVDYLFESYAKMINRPTVGVILTGMGKDGAQGLLSLKQNGAWTMAQDETSSVVFGMPKEAIRLGAVHEVRPLNEIAEVMAQLYSRALLKRAG